MSPYRVLISKSGSDNMILAAMLSVNKLTQNRDIYIIQKIIPSESQMKTDKVIAHLQSSKRNTVILDKYEILKELEFRRCYRVRHISSLCILSDVELTQQDCLRAAMQDYCSRNRLTILSTL